MKQIFFFNYKYSTVLPFTTSSVTGCVRAGGRGLHVRVKLPGWVGAGVLPVLNRLLELRLQTV